MKDLFPPHVGLMVKPILNAAQRTLGSSAFINRGSLVHCGMTRFFSPPF